MVNDLLDHDNIRSSAKEFYLSHWERLIFQDSIVALRDRSHGAMPLECRREADLSLLLYLSSLQFDSRAFNFYVYQ